MHHRADAGVTSAETAWSEARDRSTRALSRSEAESVDVELLGEPVRVTAGSTHLTTQLTAAVAHLPGPVRPVDLSTGLTVRAWDVESTGIRLERSVDDGAEGPVRRSSDGEVRMTSLGDGRWVHLDRGPYTALMDRRDREVLVCFDRADLPPHVRAKPLVMLVRVWANDLGHEVFHAGAITHDDRCVLVAGDSGAGKTTACLRAWADGMELLGDDHVALIDDGDDNGHELVHSLYSSTRVEPDNLDRVPELRPHVEASVDPADSKHVAFLTGTGVGCLGVASPVGGLVIPTVCPGRPTRLRPLSAGAALRELAPSFVSTTHGDRRGAFDRLGKLLASVPTARLELGTKLDRLPALLTSVLNDRGCSGATQR